MGADISGHDSWPGTPGLQDLVAKTFFRPRDAAELGVDSRALRRLVDDGSVERVARGLYRVADAEPTEHYTLAAVCARVPGAIVCLLSALSVHGLGTQLPWQLDRAASGVLQLPDFQRGWVWDDDHIRSLLVSISLSYPIGAVMTLVAGNPDVNFKARLLEGVTLAATPAPEMLLLDGQQRLTSLFQALKSRDPVCTRDRRGNELHRHYYASIDACIDDTVEREEEGIVSVPADRIVRSDFGRTIDLDISTRDREIAAGMFPLDLVLDGGVTMDWQMAYLQSGSGGQVDRFEKWKQFVDAVINPFVQYHVPTIDLAKSTPKEAVCQVFEKVNTGGVTLTVFELLTAT